MDARRQATDESRFDTLVRALASPSRRAMFSALTATLFGGALGISTDEAEAKRKRGKHGKPDNRGEKDKHKQHNARYDNTDAVKASGKKKKKKKKKKSTIPTTVPPPPVIVPPPPTECTTPDTCPAPPAAFLCAEATCVNADCGFGAKSAGTVCRAAAGECDIAEVCDGVALDCPPNRFAATGKACTNPAGGRGTCRDGVCIPECTTAAMCPAPPAFLDCAQATCIKGTCGIGPKFGNTLCRPVAGICDFSELCNGTALTCPPDRFIAGLPCGSPPGCRDKYTVRLQAICSGGGATCPPPSTFDCRPYICSNGNCRTGCGSDDSLCYDTHYCTGGLCQPTKTPGGSCTRDRECVSGLCRGGFCCSGACANDHGTAACAAGTGACSVTCAPGWGNCDGNASNGCETNLDPSGPWTLVDQGDGTCNLACDPGWGNCDGDPSTGCETDLNTSENCGACGASCPTIKCGGRPDNPSFQQCVDGACLCVASEPIDP